MNILLPVDGSALSLQAVHHAIRLTRQGLNASFVLANVQEHSSLYEVMVMHDAEALQRVRLTAGEHSLAEADALLTEAGIEHQIEVALGDPAHTLIDIIERFQCDSVIMGAHGMGESSAVVGDVAQALLRGSPVPVMIVRPPPEPESLEEESDAARAAASQGADADE
ncbi:universal stress protein [Piscinibacter sp.]|uniref:universal stress protein n=1 Tax=Piscinibacter sp. TaxID=1903157 RepID=UPI002CF0A305|nr:universal stress protein [Albitalea sp.]HUG21471.1 universal stress protein [Albitalea sp.]